MERILRPLKQDGSTGEIWKSVTPTPEGDTDPWSDVDHRPLPHHFPTGRGTKRTADGEKKISGNVGQYATVKEEGLLQVKMQSPPAAMPLESRSDNADDEDQEFKPSV